MLVVGGPSPLLAEGAGGGSPPLLAGVLWCWWWVAPRHSWLRVPGAVPRHSWLGSGGSGGGRFRGVQWGVSPVACVCRAARAGVCAVCLWRWCGCGCVFSVCWHVCGGVWRFVSLAGACRWCLCGWGCGWCVVGPSPLLAEVPACVSPPLLAWLRRRWWWVHLATPG